MKVELKKHEIPRYIESLKTMIKIANGDGEWVSWKMQLESVRKTMDLIKELEEENEKEQEKKL